MKNSFFVTGTGTCVGKTVVSAVLYSWLKTQGSVSYLKPIQTGCDEDSDYGTVNELAGPVFPSEEISVPVQYKLPASPHLAAEYEQSKIDVDVLKKHVSDNLVSDNNLIEGAGGIMVPITREYMTWEVMRDLNLPVILVTAPILGTINHTMLSIDFLASKGLELWGTVVSGVSNDPGPIEADNLKLIEDASPRFLTVPKFEELNKSSVDVFVETNAAKLEAFFN